MKHIRSSVPVIKMDGGCIGHRWRCSCGRGGNGIHSTIEKALEAAKDHIK